VRIPARFNGPPGSANGGYTCGLVAGLLGGEAEVTLRVPPPLERELRVVHADGRVELRDGDTLIAEGERASVEVDVPSPVSLAEAEAASTRYAGLAHHAYPTCFTCGPEREDGLGIYAGAVAGRDGIVAAPWTPAEEPAPEVVWAALDCPSGWAVDDFQRDGVLLGRMAARVDRLPVPGEPHVVVGWRVAEEGRKRYAGSALTTADGEVLARSRSTWIVRGTATGTGPAPAA
jgi:hypothetical protein